MGMTREDLSGELSQRQLPGVLLGVETPDVERAQTASTVEASSAPRDTLLPQPTRATPRRRTRRVARIARRVVGAIGTVLILAFGLFGLGSLTHQWRVVPVLSNSMRPKLTVGSAVIVTPMPAADVEPGDIIVFHAPTPPHAITVHRVRKVLEPGPHPVVQTKGDANPVPDPEPTRLVGDTVWKVRAVVPHLGTLTRDAPLTTGAFALGVLLLVISLVDWARDSVVDADDPATPLV